MRLTEDNTRKLFNKLKFYAVKSYNRNKIDRSLSFIKAASHTAYTFYLEFKDDEIESLLSKISYSIKKSEPLKEFSSNKCVFYDSFSLDNKGLTQQYIRAIAKAGWDLLYITDSNKNNPRAKDIIDEIKQYNKSTVIEVPSNSDGIKRAQFIYDAIIEFNPNKLFMHISPSAVYAITVFYALPKSIEKFQINLTDHAFWAGSGCLDYSLEFRAYGASLSINKRGIPKDNVFIIPYYPIIKENDFIGLPTQCDDKIIVLSGGAYYKIIDDEGVFFKLIKLILDVSENVVVLFAGAGDDSIFFKFIKENNYEDRLLLLGHRNDISEVFKRSDIYLNTYPFIGGLMCQYAAHNSKPILSFSSENLSKAEEIVCQKNYEEISIFTFDDFEDKAKKLITNDKYRKLKGDKLKKCVVDESDFNDIFTKTVSEKNTQVDFISSTVFIQNDIKNKLHYENRTNEFKLFLIRTLGIKSIFISPFLFYDVMRIIIFKKKYYSKLYRLILKRKL